ncbi:hypothetical protein HNP32_001865 [Brevundimonas bullata]|uniref:Uncharacterized protein n=1 Tax=Brevundimonas bullata TaxID=13160 RepID=A0A7W7N479_9CAUL|nr:hypothetical protein [Brevundimonas bullata]MBB6383565.1 hypothetical protein [Brevundimonas bullata]
MTVVFLAAMVERRGNLAALQRDDVVDPQQ